MVAAGGRGLATATGDLLFSRAFAELARSGSTAAVRALSHASSGLACGELMQRADAWCADVAVERYLERCRLKTAVLFRAACELGALDFGGPVELLGAFGEQIGVAFQILDDVLDVSGPPERTGKPQGTDLLDGTVTLPLLIARERDPQLAALDLREVRDARAGAGGVRADRGDRRPRDGQSAGARARRRCQGHAPGAPRRAGPRTRAARRRGRRAVLVARTAKGLEVFGEDQVGVQRCDEAIDLIGHVRVRQPL